MKVMRLAAAMSTTAAVLLTYLYGKEESSNRSVFNMCVGYSQAFQVIQSLYCYVDILERQKCKHKNARTLFRMPKHVG
jgi:hypothetical protein